MTPILVDSNIIIYTLQAPYADLRKWMQEQIPVISTITQLEVLGYYGISQTEIEIAYQYFSFCQIIPVDNAIIQTAIKLRQAKKMSLGDAIIAATALVHKLPLATANTKDFKHLEEVVLLNPLEM